jgi:hypothetical protein
MLAAIMTRRSHERQAAYRCLGLVLGLALAGADLASCGQASIPVPTCGTVNVNHLGQVSNGAAAGEAETCFYHAFQQCQQASLGVTWMTGVDTGAQDLFSVQSGSGGKCSISDAQYSYVNTSVSLTTTVTCAGLSRQNGGMLFTSCGARNVSIPAPAPTPSTAP